MSDCDLIDRLIASPEYAALQRLRPEFNLFSLLGDALREPAWSRIFTGLLDSTQPHGLGDEPLRGWLAQIAAEQPAPDILPEPLRALSVGSVVRTTPEFTTPKGRRLDILIRVFDAEHRLVAVVGVENKLHSPELPSQVADYQAGLDEVFRGVPRVIVFLTPNRRPSESAGASSACRCVPASYRTMVALCEALQPRAEGDVRLLLNSLPREIEAAVLGEDRMKAEARNLIEKLWADPDHRRAIKLLIECVPTQRQLWDTQLLSQLQAKITPCGIEIEELDYYPRGSASPREIKFNCGAEVADRTAPLGFHFIYMLHCGQAPDIGSEFSLRLGAWCDTATGRKRLQTMKLREVLPQGREPKSWSQWEGIWTGGLYILRDLGPADVEGLVNLCSEGVRETYPKLVAEVAKLDSATGTKRTR